MKTKRSYSIAWKIAAIIIIVACIIYANNLRNESEVKGVNITIDYDGRDTLVTANHIEKIIFSKIPNINIMTIEDIDRKQIASIVKSNPFIGRCNVSTSIKGTVQVNAVQRVPIVRVVCTDKQFYLDNNGYYMPTSKISSQNVIIASGTIKGKVSDTIDFSSMDTTNSNISDIHKIYYLVTYILNHEDLANMFDQIYVCKDGDIELVPKIGNHTIVIGDIDNLDSKFEKLLAVYKGGFGNNGWNKYKKINLKYKNQVVCTKK